MKFSRIALISLLVVVGPMATATALAAYTPTFGPTTTKPNTKEAGRAFTTTLRYTDSTGSCDFSGSDPSAAAADAIDGVLHAHHMDGVVVSQVSEEDASMVVESLAFSLGMDESMLQTEYQEWLTKYSKPFSQARFVTWKRNFLMQEVWNRTNREDFVLNEFGDYTKDEFDEAWQMVPVGMEDDEEQIAVPPAPSTKQRGHHAVSSTAPTIMVPSMAATTSTSEAAAVPKRRFKKIKTFSGGYRMVPCEDKPVELYSSRPRFHKKTTPQTATVPSSSKFRKVPDFCGGVTIVPANRDRN